MTILRSSLVINERVAEMLDILHDIVGEVDVVYVRGRIDRATSREMDSLMNQLVSAKRLNIVLDLSGVIAMDSSGLRILVSVLKATRPRGGDLRLVNPSERVVEMLRFSGLVAVFKRHATIQEAMDSFGITLERGPELL